MALACTLEKQDLPANAMTGQPFQFRKFDQASWSGKVSPTMIKTLALMAARTALLLALVVPSALAAATNTGETAASDQPSDEIRALNEALQDYDTAIDGQNQQRAAIALDRIDARIDALAQDGEPLDENVTTQVKRRIADARHALAGREWMQAQQAIVEATRAMRQSETGRHSTPEN